MNRPSKLTADYLAHAWPRLFHMAEAGTWPSIQRFGLLSTTALLDLYAINGPSRDSIESARRPESVRIHNSEYGTAWIRDNKPINETVLRRTVAGMTEPEWYRSINSRVFFWLAPERLARLRNAPPYRDRSHDILVLDTAKLLTRHADLVELSPLNSGAVHPAANYPRGAGTFERISHYPWGHRCRLAPKEPIVELTVPYSLQDVEAFVIEISTA